MPEALALTAKRREIKVKIVFVFMIKALMFLGKSQKIFVKWYLKPRLTPVFKQLAKKETNLLNEIEQDRRLWAVTTFLDSLGLINFYDFPYEGDIKDITHIRFSGRKRGYEVCAEGEEGKSLDQWESQLYEPWLKPFDQNECAEKEWQEVNAKIFSDSRTSLHFSNFDEPTFYRWAYQPDVFQWCDVDGAHRVFKLRYLAKLLNRDWEVKGHVKLHFLNQERAKSLIEDDWFLFSLEAPYVDAIELISWVLKQPRKVLCPTKSVLDLGPECFKLIRLRSSWHLKKIALDAGMFDFSNFIKKLLSTQKEFFDQSHDIQDLSKQHELET